MMCTSAQAGPCLSTDLIISADCDASGITFNNSLVVNQGVTLTGSNNALKLKIILVIKELLSTVIPSLLMLIQQQ